MRILIQNEKHRMKYILLSIILLLSIGQGFAQEQTLPEKDKVILRNHSQVDGQIIEVSKKWVVIKVGNVPFTFNKNKIASIYYDGEVISFVPLYKEKIKDRAGEVDKVGGVVEIPGYRMVAIKETAKRGFYNVTYSTFHFRSGGEFENNEFGFGISNTTGYQFNRYTGLGLGIGYHDNPGFFRRGNIVPVFAEYRGYFSDKKVSPYYSLAYGLSFGTKNEESQYNSTKPGSYFYPAIGFKSGSVESSIMIDVGLRFSQVTYVFDQDISTTGTSAEETIFNRGFILRVGVLF